MTQNVKARPTALHQMHVDQSARLVNFSGHLMPLHYGSVFNEHQAVRKSAGMFDLSHLSVIEIHGSAAKNWLRMMLSNDVAKLRDGQSMYTCLCYEHGGVVDDMLVFRLGEMRYRMYIDAARRAKDLAWMDGHLKPNVEITEMDANAIIAVQGPEAIDLTAKALHGMGVSLPLLSLPGGMATEQGQWFIARTGYTGEDGLEITLPDCQAVSLWQAMSDQGVLPAGLGARDSLRVEAGFALYGQEIDEEHSPEESGIGRTIDISDPERHFIGREPLEEHKRFGGRFFQVGLMLDGSGLMRRGATVELVGRSVGTITSGIFSPYKSTSVGLARVERRFKGRCDVTVHEQLRTARTASVPFVPHRQIRE